MVDLLFDFDESFYSGTAPNASTVPWKWDIALDGHVFVIDDLHVQFAGQHLGSFIASSVPLSRTQADTSNEPGEQTLSPDAPWRRALESWHSGAGQHFQDRPDSDRNRFYTSKGINCWTKYQTTLLNDTSLQLAQTGTHQYMAVTDTAIYVGNDNVNTLKRSVDGTTWTVPTGMPATVPLTSLTTDGTTVYAGVGASGVYTGTGSAFTSYVTGTVDLVRYCNGRLIVAAGPSLYNPVQTGSLTTSGVAGATSLLFTDDASTWHWVDACNGPKFIYVAGYSGSTSSIYRIPILSTGLGLGIPVIAGTLEPGEVATSISNNQGSIVVGTNVGIRFATADSSGDLVFGDLIPTTSPVLCSTTWNRFIWCGLTNYDTVSTGLMRLDPLTFTDAVTPAYATDLMATTQGAVQAVVFFNGVCYFSVSGVGVYKDSGVPVASGTMTSGRITYNLPDMKNVLSVDLLHSPLTGVISVAISPDDGTLIQLGASSAPNSVSPDTPLAAGQQPCRWVNVVTTLTPSANVSPILHRVTALSWPSPHRSIQTILPLLFEDMVTINDIEEPFDCVAGEAIIRELLESGRFVPLQSGNVTEQVVVSDIEFLRKTNTSDRLGWQGTMVVTVLGV